MKKRLHVGCGDKRWPGYCNTDAFDDPLLGPPDFRYNVMERLEMETESVDEIHTIHLFEHIHRGRINDLLTDWHRVLKRGGKLCMEMPSLDKIARFIVNGETNMRLTLLGIYGDPQDPKPGMMHQWGWTERELREVLDQNGFRDITFPEPKFHVPTRDLRVEAIKP